MGWPINAHRNAAVQALQQAEAQRRRADQLAVRNRRLRAATATSMAILVSASLLLLSLGLLLGYAAGTGLIGLVGR
jgi:hypothetical protein